MWSGNTRDLFEQDKTHYEVCHFLETLSFTVYAMRIWQSSIVLFLLFPQPEGLTSYA